ncbi:unnamed protein product [Cuscuta epithymum]|uniref:Protein kinase domain-containing protein n=2 Tax=Cuscuta epithymum TaxID=186058 RepID=A0AAV0G6A4_9ASTE|nr:unnamed protein product [Cuscuta epithymum]
MDQSKSQIHSHYLTTREHSNAEVIPETQFFRSDMPEHDVPDLIHPESKPVLNYSIQTGEEFSLEFMLDRFNIRKPHGPNTSVDPSQTPGGHLELKGVLGISHTGAERGLDIHMLTTTKSSRDMEERNYSLSEVKSVNGPTRPGEQTSTENSSFQTHMYASSASGASDSSVARLKILCSFGGKILPRPSDGKLRYVGGETRIVRIRKDITWHDLWKKAISIYDLTHVIKYQLPGEDLDALVSVSCDEDLQNMMEECFVLDDREGSKKLRMFLFSMIDLEDTHFNLTNSHSECEIQYFVAVNGFDMDSRKNSVLHCIESSANNLDDLDVHNVAMDTGSVATNFIDENNQFFSGFDDSSSLPKSSEQHNSHGGYLSEMHLYHRQMPPYDDGTLQNSQHGINLNSFMQTRECVIPRQNDIFAQKEDVEGQLLDGPSVNPHIPIGVKPVRSDANASAHQGEEFQYNQILSNEQLAALHLLNNNVKGYFTIENGGKPHYPIQTSSPLETGSPELPNSSRNDRSCACVPETAPIDLSFFESNPPPPPQRVFCSERIPREQAELLKRVSKSDDSHNSQLLMTHPHSDVTQTDLHTESAENVQSSNSVQTEQIIPDENPLPLGKNQKVKQAVPIGLDLKDKASESQVDLHGTVSMESVITKKIADDSMDAGSRINATSGLNTVKHHEGSENCLPDIHQGDRIGSELLPSKSIHQGLSQHSDEKGSYNGVVGLEEPDAGMARSEQGDIIIDINDRFPRDILSDIFAQAILSGSVSNINSTPNNGAGVSVNVENLDPKNWSFFQKLAGDEFAKSDVSLIDQDHLGYSSRLQKVEVLEEASSAYGVLPSVNEGVSLSHLDQQVNVGVDDQTELSSTVGPNSRMLHSGYGPNLEYEDGIRDTGLPPLGTSLVDVDLSSLQIIRNEDLEEMKELGSGTFGTVYHGKWRGSDVAIKRIKKSCFTVRSSEQERLTLEFWREADILSKLHHPNVVAFYGVVQDGIGGTLATVTEYMVDGSLRHVLIRKDRHLDRRKRIIIAMDAAFGMEYLHSKNIVHFDLKCDNLLVNLKDPSRPICKVGDFGLSKIKRNTLVSGGVRGTLPWMAPELLNGSSNKVSEKVDVFSFGIVLWEILTGEEPYANMHYGAIIGGIVSNTLRPSIPNQCDPEWRKLMEQCWAPNPSSRPSFTEIASRLRTLLSTAAPPQSKAPKPPS